MTGSMSIPIHSMACLLHLVWPKAAVVAASESAKKGLASFFSFRPRGQQKTGVLHTPLTATNQSRHHAVTDQSDASIAPRSGGIDYILPTWAQRFLNPGANLVVWGSMTLKCF